MVRWGIMGAGNVARRFAESLQHEKNSKLSAIAVRTAEKAEIFRENYKFERYYLNYADLLEDQEIDAIYLSLPHGLHKEWAKKALRKGKAVLCEKPAALTADEVKEIAQAAEENQCLFMEAMKSRFVPAYQEIKKILLEGAIGSVIHVEATLCNLAPVGRIENSYHTQAVQGGVLLDTGIYCASWIEELLEEEIWLDKVQADICEEIDYYVKASFSSGEKTAKMEVAFDRKKPNRLVIFGEKGKMEITDFHRAQEIRIETKEGYTIVKKPFLYDDFFGEISHFVELMKNKNLESPVMPIASSVRCAEILDLVRKGFGNISVNQYIHKRQ